MKILCREAIALASSVALLCGTASAQLPFQQEVIAPAVAAWGKALADLDGDGNDDIVVAGGQLGSNVSWRAAPDWSEYFVGDLGGGDDLQIADINADGAPDVVVNGGPVIWYENPRGSGADPTQPWIVRSVPDSTKAHDLAVGDVDGDGHIDILTRGEFGPTNLYLQKQDGWTHVPMPTAPDGEGSALCDIDNDGRVDIVGNGYWLSQPADAVDEVWPIHALVDFPEGASVACADVNSDGRLDVVLAASEVGPGKLSWFEAPPDRLAGDWLRHHVDDVEDVHRIHLIDISRDGKPDIVFGEMHQSTDRRVGIYVNNGDATFTLQVLSTEGTHNIAVGDVDGDGDVDLLGANWNLSASDEGALKLWRNSSEGASCAAEPFKVLVFSRTLEFRHASIPTGIAALKEMGQSAGFEVWDTEDPSIFTDEGLAPFRVVVFLNPSGEILDAAQQQVFKSFINAGGGFVGIHNPTAYVLEDWDWYTGLVAARYESELEGTMQLHTVTKEHPATAELPDEWTFDGEAYNFAPNPKVNGVTVLLNLDEGSVSGGTMGADHPISWYHLYDGGRAFYTVLGADDDDYDTPEFRAHVTGAIQWAADTNRPTCPDSVSQTGAPSDQDDASTSGEPTTDAGETGDGATAKGALNSGETPGDGNGATSADTADAGSPSPDDADKGTQAAEMSGEPGASDGNCTCTVARPPSGSAPTALALGVVGLVMLRRRRACR